MIELKLIKMPITWVVSALGGLSAYLGVLDPIVGWILGHAGTLFALAGLGVRFGDIPRPVLMAVAAAYGASLVIRLGGSALKKLGGGGGG